jgi:uncharacterized protein YdhG (YjbR/CyaY superfamily)
MAQTGPTSTVDGYVAALPDEVRARMDALRRVLRSVVPDVEETISYAMPTFVLDGRPLVHVAAWKHHIGLYPLPPLDATLEREVAPWRGAEDAMTLPHTEPLPVDLVERVVTVLLEQRRGGGRPPSARRPAR